MKLKVCGMREEANIHSLAELKPDYIGLILYPGSRRYVSDLNPRFLSDLSADIIRTGVFVDEQPAIVLQKVKQYGLKAIQLHGSETKEYCQSLKEAIRKKFEGIELIKAFGIDESFDFAMLDLYNDEVDYFLFDTKTPTHGGSGLKFNWKILEKYHLNKPYFLSGGIGLEDLNELTAIKDHRLYAVDLNSKFETTPGLKDIGQIKKAFNVIKTLSNSVNNN